jgi:hypothetical protein
MEASYLDALVFYRTKFLDLESLGEGTPPAAWLAELNAVTPEALGSVLGTSVQGEGGTVSGQRNFDQIFRVRALHARRAELDPDYTNPYTLAAEEPMPRRRCGFLVRLGV